MKVETNYHLDLEDVCEAVRKFVANNTGTLYNQSNAYIDFMYDEKTYTLIGVKLCPKS